MPALCPISSLHDTRMMRSKLYSTSVVVCVCVEPAIDEIVSCVVKPDAWCSLPHDSKWQLVPLPICFWTIVAVSHLSNDCTLKKLLSPASRDLRAALQLSASTCEECRIVAQQLVINEFKNVSSVSLQEMHWDLVSRSIICLAHPILQLLSDGRRLRKRTKKWGKRRNIRVTAAESSAQIHWQSACIANNQCYSSSI